MRSELLDPVDARSRAADTRHGGARRLAAPLAVALAAAVLAGCAVVPPSSPSVMALPGSSKSFDQFRRDDYNCRQYAFNENGGVDANQAATSAAVGSAVVGTAIGAAAGAAFGGGHGAAVGAGAGLLAGSAIGANNAQASAYATQERYDQAYVQCMYASGNRVPMRGGTTMGVVSSQPVQQYAPPPPPPPGWTPPPGYY